VAKPDERRTPKPPGTGPFDELLDMEGELFEAGVWSSLSRLAKREGLPPQYAMRHDAHYVDELVSSREVRQIIRVPVKHFATTPREGQNIRSLADSIGRFGILQPLLVRRRRGRYEIIAGRKRLAAAKAAGLTEVPCLLYDVDDSLAQSMQEATNLRSASRDMKLRTIFPLLGQTLQTIISCLRVLDTDSPHGNRAASDLIQTEAERAAQLTWGATLIAFTPNLILHEFDGAEVMEAVLRTLEKEHTLDEFTFDKRIQRPCLLKADKRLVFVAMRGAVDTILPLALSRRKATVAVRLARHSPSRYIVVQVSQSAIRPPNSVWSRWFDLDWCERPGGIASGVGLLAAKRVLELHKGRLSIAPRQDGGCQITLGFPEAAASGKS
jgi:hypothetical protein